MVYGVFMMENIDAHRASCAFKAPYFLRPVSIAMVALLSAAPAATAAVITVIDT
jgi:hypothetical protein